MIPNLTKYVSQVITNCDTGAKCETHLPNIGATSANLQNILQLVFGIIAATAVIFIIISAIRYQVSLGNPEANAKLRNTIIYAAIGLVIALSAEIIVTFAIGKV